MRGRRPKPEILALCEVLPVKEPVPEGLMDTAEAASVVGCSGAALLAAMRRRELKPYVHGWKLYWSFKDLDAWGSDEAKEDRSNRKFRARGIQR